MPGERFESTVWTVVLAAGEDDSGIARGALETLSKTYWYPLYSYIRHRGYTAEDAADLTQGFFLHLLERGCVKSADPGKGRFRSFLLGCVDLFLASERTKAGAQKRGGNHIRLDLDFGAAEERYRLGPSHTLAPEDLFDAEWARTVIDQVLARLAAEFAAADKSAVFECLHCCLPAGKHPLSYKELARELAMSEGAVKVAVHRLRRRYGALLHQAVAETVDTQEDVEAELRYLVRMAGE